MTERERLIELIRNAPKTDVVYGDIKLKDPIQTLQTIADYLLANGVIVPPCKVGDILWIPSVNSNKVYSKIIKEILIHEKDEEIGKYVYASSAYFPFENIGKTVFLTKEEAEAELKGVINNDRHRNN